MALVSSLDQAAAGLARFAAALQAVAAEPIRVEVAAAAAAGADRAEAEAIKRGQRPEQVAAMKKALGLS